MARPAATPEQRARKRFLIRDAAAELAREVGPAGVTIRKIAERAGVSVGTVYKHFGSLTDITRSLWTEPVAEANQRMR